MNKTTVIWDFGGVITSSPFDAFNRMEEERGMPINSVRKINAADPDSNEFPRIIFKKEALLGGFVILSGPVFPYLFGGNAFIGNPSP